MSLSILAESLARIEHKLDALLRQKGTPVYPMHFTGNLCAGCGKPVEYQIDVASQVVVRRCECSTGKIPSAIPLLPVAPTTGVPNGYPTSDANQLDNSQDSSRRKAR